MEQRQEKIKGRSLKRLTVILLCSVLFLLLPLAELGHAVGIIPQAPTVAVLELFGASAVNSTSTQVAFCSVGQGDCTVIKSGNAVAVIDFGEEKNAPALSAQLRRLGVGRIDLALVTHLHTDHLGGFSNIIKEFPVQTLVMRADDTLPVAVQARAAAVSAGTQIVSPAAGQLFRVGGATLEVLFVNPYAKDENNRSAATMVTLMGRKIFLPGDIEAEAMDMLLDGGIDISCDILKLPHHGGASAADVDFLKAAAPRLAVASSGYDNSHGHPAMSTLALLKQQGIPLYRTDLNGMVQCRFSGTEMKVSTERG